MPAKILAAFLLVLGACVTISAPAQAATQHKVLVIMEENHSASEAFNGMPYLASLANRYGKATNYHAISHPSLPNYLAISGGSTFGVTNDNGPSAHPVYGNSVMDQTISMGKESKWYVEGMTKNCDPAFGTADVDHHPWPYYAAAGPRGHCLSSDLPMGTTTSGNLHNAVANGSLPATGFMTPNLNNDAHNGTLAQADRWLKGWIPEIMRGPDWKNGNLTIIVTFDEGDRSQSNTVAFVVIDPRLSGKVVTSAANHYSLTRWLDQNIGAPLLRNAGTAANLKGAFGL